jgi:hypothetical protein
MDKTVKHAQKKDTFRHPPKTHASFVQHFHDIQIAGPYIGQALFQVPNYFKWDFRYFCTDDVGFFPDIVRSSWTPKFAAV